MFDYILNALGNHLSTTVVRPLFNSQWDHYYYISGSATDNYFLPLLELYVLMMRLDILLVLRPQYWNKT